MFNIEALSTVIKDTKLQGQLAAVMRRFVEAEILGTRALNAMVINLVKTDDQSGERFRSFIERHAEFYGDLVERSLVFHQGVLDTLKEDSNRQNNAIDASTQPDLSLNITCIKGETCRTPFKVTNSYSEPITVSLRATPFVSQDGDELISGAVSFDPPNCQIGSNGEVVIDAIISTEQNFKAGNTYLATLFVEGAIAMRIVAKMNVTRKRRAKPPKKAPRAKEKAATASRKSSSRATAVSKATKPKAPAAKARKAKSEPRKRSSSNQVKRTPKPKDDAARDQ